MKIVVSGGTVSVAAVVKSKDSLALRGFPLRSIAATVIVAEYVVPKLNGPVGVSVAVIVGSTFDAPSLRENDVASIVAGLIGSENTAVTLVLMETSVDPSAGPVDITAGGVVSGAGSTSTTNSGGFVPSLESNPRPSVETDARFSV